MSNGPSAQLDGNAGGFLSPTIPSPPPSSITSTSLAPSTLPRPRHQPLKPGSPKETTFIQHVDHGILQITRKYAKKFSGDGEGEAEAEVRGYESLKEVGRDMERLVNVVWVSGTPSLQTPYLLSLALLLATYLPYFPPAPRTTFHLLHKFDLAFASLLQGHDVDSGDPLPGFETGKGVSMTEKVRIKSLVERTRVTVVQVMRSGEIVEDESAASTEDVTDDDPDNEDDDMNDDVGVGDAEGTRWDMEIARVYDQTMVELRDLQGLGASAE
ncbi:MAG: Ribosomal RNA-processing protein 7 [Piccolia ochrophora]|nr:MAG: Ribosomal RNA-processing protein 7 [Piccolia ochrophora]